MAERFSERKSIPDLEMYQDGLNKLPEVLSILGFEKLRAGQDRVVMNLLACMDTVCILPTSLGKSACYITPTLCHGWHSIVVSPLTALMRDQVKSCWNKGISSDQISSTQTEGENLEAMKRWVDGKTSILFVAPERFENEIFMAAINSRKPDAIFLDEAHCLSSWCDNFRPSYKVMGDVIQRLNPRVVGAFTATAPPEVEKDIRWVLGLGKAEKVLHYPRRTNLHLSSETCDEGETNLRLFSKLKRIQGSSIVYFSTITRLEETLYAAQNFIKEPITYYYGEMDPALKRSNQDMWMEDKARIIFATSAFGMGIDKPNVRHVFERDITGSVEACMQQLGRAGRDGNDSWCHSFLSPDSIRTQDFFLRMAHPTMEDITAMYNALDELADGSGFVDADWKTIGKNSGVSGFMIDSVTQALISDNVIRRSKEKSTTAFIKFHKIDKADKRMVQWFDAITEGGVATSDNAVEIDLDWLSNKLGYTSQASVKKWLKQWTQDGMITFVPPPPRAPLEIMGGLDRIDFARLKKKRDDSYRKLEEVKYYFEVPDKEKHAYVEHIFKLHNGESK
jgi:ATP-dependent DNA helicase RecQ